MKRSKVENSTHRLRSWANHPNDRTSDVACDVRILLDEIDRLRNELVTAGNYSMMQRSQLARSEEKIQSARDEAGVIYEIPLRKAQAALNLVMRTQFPGQCFALPDGDCIGVGCVHDEDTTSWNV